MAVKAAQKRTAPKAKSKAAQQKTETEPSVESAAQLQQQQDELQQPGQVGKKDADFIDNDPGYSEDQLDHMREYYGLKESTAAVAEV